MSDEILHAPRHDQHHVPHHDFAPGTYALCYTGSTPNPREVVNTLGSGAVYSTPTDLAKMASMFMNGGVYNGVRILSAASVAQMGVDQTVGTFNPVPSNNTRYGLGWDTITEPGLRAVGVTGWMKGGDSSDYHAAFTVAPNARLAVIAEGVAPLSSGVLETLAQRILLRALAERRSIPRMPAQISPTAIPPLVPTTAAQVAAVTGYWAESGSAYRTTASTTGPRAVYLTSLHMDGWTSSTSPWRLRTDGRWYPDTKNWSLRRVNSGNRSYLVLNMPSGYGHYRTDMVIGEKLATAAPLPSAWQARLGDEWLLVNEDQSSPVWTADGAARLTLSDMPGSPGHLFGSVPDYGLQFFDAGAGDTLAAMFLQIPGFGSRDMGDLNVVDRGGQEWMRFGSSMFRPRATIASLPGDATTTVSIGTEGYAEWRTIEDTATLRIMGAATAWRLYDSDLHAIDGGTTIPVTTTTAGSGCYLLVFGPASTDASVSVQPLVGGPVRVRVKEPARTVRLR